MFEDLLSSHVGPVRSIGRVELLAREAGDLELFVSRHFESDGECCDWLMQELGTGDEVKAAVMELYAWVIGPNP